METPSNEKKKKKGFLSFLMRIFIIFVVIIMIATGLFYWKKKTVTIYALNFYSSQLSSSLTSEKHYQFSEDQEYKIEYEGKKGEASFDEAQIKKRILEQRHKEVSIALQNLIINYNENSTKKWQRIFAELRQDINNMFVDQQISVDEYKLFLAKLEAYSK
ncbi:hypothetical protein [Candidatus Uabimicrobium sp. HlEnr_7]|uniref:hypothetical protein n=1 Tax=Candidatus Uabimicrobium helgolandensis TaxID=3095367 RepID=UPI003555FDAB